MPKNSPVAVIDIGSNSVRLVIYDGLKRVPLPLFNEKVLCGLAEGMEKTNRLSKKGAARAEKAIMRFVNLSQIMGAKSLKLFATSAVRDAEDGSEFVARIKEKYSATISIFSGEDEAKYASLGVVSSIANAQGVVGDLGGGSLELNNLSGLSVGQGMSFPIGPLRMVEKDVCVSKYQKQVDKYISQFPLEEYMKGKSFYTVGGAFRNLAKVHMAWNNYPLKVIQNYSIAAEEIMKTVSIIIKMPESSLVKISGIPKKRVNFLPFAALIVARIIEIGRPKNIVFCANGIREGVLFEKLSKKEYEEDPLIAGAVDRTSRIFRSSKYGYELAKWMDGLFENESEHDKNLRLAACIMSEISCYENAEYRAELAYRKILDSSLTGLTHRDRVFIAKALYCRYSAYDDKTLSDMQPLLDRDSLLRAKMTGYAMRLGRSLSCSTDGVLSNTSLKYEDEDLVLRMKDKSIMGEAVVKRIKSLANLLNADYYIV